MNMFYFLLMFTIIFSILILFRFKLICLMFIEILMICLISLIFTTFNYNFFFKIILIIFFSIFMVIDSTMGISLFVSSSRNSSSMMFMFPNLYWFF